MTTQSEIPVFVLRHHLGPLPQDLIIMPRQYGMTLMGLNHGTLYVTRHPESWNAYDRDRAAALGYGERCSWPVPERIEVRQDTSAQLQQEGKDSWLSFHIELCKQFAPAKLNFQHGCLWPDRTYSRLLVTHTLPNGIRHSLTVTRADHERWDDDTLARKIMLALKEGRTTLQ